MSWEVVLGLGSNLGERLENLETAAARLHGDAVIVAPSFVYESEAITLPGSPAQPRFLNAALRVETDLDPQEFLTRMLQIEQEMGRVRKERWEARIIDLDLLWSPTVAVHHDRLELPHPGLLDRAFALIPLLDVAPDAPGFFRDAASKMQIDRFQGPRLTAPVQSIR